MSTEALLWAAFVMQSVALALVLIRAKRGPWPDRASRDKRLVQALRDQGFLDVGTSVVGNKNYRVFRAPTGGGHVRIIHKNEP